VNEDVQFFLFFVLINLYFICCVFVYKSINVFVGFRKYSEKLWIILEIHSEDKKKQHEYFQLMKFV